MPELHSGDPVERDSDADALPGRLPAAGVVGRGGRRVRRRGARWGRRRAQSTLTTVAAGEAHELVERHREHRVRRAARGPDLGVAGEVLVDDRRERRGVPGRARLRRSPDRSPPAPAPASRAGSLSRPRRAASAAVSTRCAPLVMTSSGSSSDQNTRLFAIAPTSTPSAAAASGAVEAASGSTTMSPAIPAARRESWTRRLRAGSCSVIRSGYDRQAPQVRWPRARMFPSLSSNQADFSPASSATPSTVFNPGKS